MAITEETTIKTAVRTSANNGVGISIVIPVYNEQDTIADVIEKVNSVATESGWDFEIVVVNDGSSDNTGAAIDAFKGRNRITVLHHEKNGGKGRAIRTGLEKVTKELTIIQDADLEYYPEDIGSLIDNMQRQTGDVIYGSRTLGARAGLSKKRRNLFAFGVEVVNIAVLAIYRKRLTDEATCYKLFKTSDLRKMNLTCEGFEFCPEVTAKSYRMGLDIKEIPIRYSPRSHTEGKKIKVIDVFYAFQTLWNFRRWNPEQPMGKKQINVESSTSNT